MFSMMSSFPRSGMGTMEVLLRFDDADGVWLFWKSSLIEDSREQVVILSMFDILGFPGYYFVCA